MYLRRIPLPLYLQEGSHSTSETSELEAIANDCYLQTGGGSVGSREQYSKKPLTRIIPSSKVRSTASYVDYSRFRDQNVTLRSTQSLDPFPSQTQRNDKIKFSKKLSKLSRGSLDAKTSGSNSINRHSHDNDNDHDVIENEEDNDDDVDEDVDLETPGPATAIINNRHDQYEYTDCVAPALLTRHRRRISDLDDDLYSKHTNNNCNGSIGNENPNCPLLMRQGSLTSPHDDVIISKRWRSLELVGGKGSHGRRSSGATTDENQCNKKSIADRIATRLAGLFNGNGFRSSDASLRKIGVIQSGVKGMTGFGEIPATEKESIV